MERDEKMIDRKIYNEYCPVNIARTRTCLAKAGKSKKDRDIVYTMFHRDHDQHIGKVIHLLEILEDPTKEYDTTRKEKIQGSGKRNTHKADIL